MRGSNIMRGRAARLGLIPALLLWVVTPAGAITWGEADGEIHRNVGAMVIQHPVGGDWFQGCSGTLIHPYIFLTAGHCTAWASFFETGQVRVNFAQDALDFTDPSTYYDVEAVITHPNFWFPKHSNPYDVGVLILKEPVWDRPVAKLADLGLLDQLKKQKRLRQGSSEEDFVIVGYGGTLHWPPPYATYEDQRQYAESEYQALLPVWLRMSQNQATGDGGSCYGDSGGPAFWIDPETDEEILVGITSWGDMPCVATGFNYRTDIPDTQVFLALVEGLVASWLAPPAEDTVPQGGKGKGAGPSSDAETSAGKRKS